MTRFRLDTITQIRKLVTSLWRQYTRSKDLFTEHGGWTSRGIVYVRHCDHLKPAPAMNKLIFLVVLLPLALCQEELNNGTDTTAAPQTTEAPSTAAPNTTTTTTTVAPNTTTTSTTTVAPTPTTTVSPNSDKYMIKEGNKVCVIVEMKAEFNISYRNNKNETSAKVFPLPPSQDTTVTGQCGNDTQNIHIDFKSMESWEFSMVFNKSSNQFNANNVTLNYKLTKAQFPDLADDLEGKQEQAMKEGVVYSASLGSSYKCDKQPIMDLSKDVVLNSTRLRLVAFKTDNSTDVANFEECTDDLVVNNTVPIAVGAALAGLVLIVLIAYLIGRRRSRRGYESV